MASRIPPRSSMPTEETSSDFLPSTITAGIPRRRSALSIGSSVVPPHMSTATSMAAVSISGSTTGPAGSLEPGMSRTPRSSGPSVLTRPSSTWIDTGSRNDRPSESPTTTPTMPDRPRRSCRPRGFGPE